MDWKDWKREQLEEGWIGAGMDWKRYGLEEGLYWKRDWKRDGLEQGLKQGWIGAEIGAGMDWKRDFPNVSSPGK